jgi:Uma2 family endonuclease
MNAIPKIATFSVDEFLRMDDRGDFWEKPKVELLDGVIYEMAPQHIPHARLKSKLGFALQSALQANPELEVFIEVSLRLGDRSLPEPDIVVCKREGNNDILSVSAALLVVEISSTTLTFDLTAKRKLYAAADVPEYWVVDVQGKVIHQHTRPEGETYAQVRQVAFGKVMQAMTIAALNVETKMLLGL